MRFSNIDGGVIVTKSQQNSYDVLCEPRMRRARQSGGKKARIEGETNGRHVLP